MAKKNYGDTLVTINSPEFVDRLAEIKGSDSGITWVDVSKKVNNEFDLDLSPSRVSDLYNKELSTEVTLNRQANKKLDRFVDSIGKRFESVSKTTDRFHRLIDRTLSALEDCEDLELLERIKDVLDVGRQNEAANRMIMNQIQLVRDEQDKISVTQKKSAYSEDEIKSNVYKQLSKTLRLLSNQGKIKIIDESILE